MDNDVYTIDTFKPIKTGEFCFQFGDDEPIRLQDVNNYGEVRLSPLQQNKWPDEHKDGELVIGTSHVQSMSFIDQKTGKTFKLFIKDVNDG